jgi:hypothetical protein
MQPEQPHGELPQIIALCPDRQPSCATQSIRNLLLYA